MMQANKATVIAGWVSLVSNLILTAIKVIVGFLFGSQVLIADGIHNAGDVIASAAALGSTIVARKPADREHPYGHGKAEVIGSAVVAVIMGLAALFIAFHSFEALLHPAAEASYIALIAAIVSFAWKQWLYFYCIRLGKKANSKSLIATAYDHLADVYASIAAVVGIGAALIGDKYDIAFLRYGDPAAGIIVAFLVLRLTYHMGRDAMDILMERNVSAEKLDSFMQLVRSVPEVKRIDRIRAREHGYYTIVDVRVGIPAQLSVQEGHDVSRKIKQIIMEHHNDVEEVMVHFNPWYESAGK
ncbi:cation diffusion facilitator family transporter [Gordoniibacillus kamchatkensis]|uniref:Cation diffusion facilitator family transporter n=1 Tax=Gordoniibacillus kamchatkensis TaxID=1590651 RepID=A0ABR5ALA9_9BACL|nr:cation diffusion facilitator family transporter [Paenibacillus sp. VKM B-2647]KIL41809.1 cation diffusion facilitator family transporter [Paenibacillus sp. VKM B-2647]